MTPRAPYAMATLANEIGALTTALVAYTQPDGLNIYRSMIVTVPEGLDELVEALALIATVDKRIANVTMSDEEDTIHIQFTDAGGRWSRTPFYLAAAWPEPEAPVERAIVDVPLPEVT